MGQISHEHNKLIERIRSSNLSDECTKSDPASWRKAV